MENIHKPYGPYERFIKRPMDFALATVAFVVLSPLLIILSAVGAVAMRGNPFFVQKRPGRIDKKTGMEKVFPLIKFRTMSNEKDKEGNLLPVERRLNTYGRFLRATSLDELPELLNIIAGQMAIVGPRPLLTEFLPLYSTEQRHRHDVRPGLTGYAQVHGRNALNWYDRFQKDVQYVHSITFRGDLRIVLDTIKVVFSHEGIEGFSSAIPVTVESFLHPANSDSDR